jgi:predicted enzyme related to lactoylglutathione lyase
MGAPIVHFEIMGKDAVKLQQFYAELFDWKIADPIPDMGMYGPVDAASSGLPGGIGQDPTGNPRVSIYAQVPDLQATLDKAIASGATMLMPPTEIPGVVTMAMFADPEGNMMGLTKG